jgi:hypothetical protein
MSNAATFQCGHRRSKSNTLPHESYERGRCRICVKAGDACRGCGWWPMSSFDGTEYEGECANCERINELHPW